MDGFEHLLSPDEVSDMLDEIASADPPSFLRRCFAEGCSSPRLSWARARELALCAMVLDSIINDRDYGLEPELIAAAKADLKKRTARVPYVSPLPGNMAPPLDTASS